MALRCSAGDVWQNVEIMVGVQTVLLSVGIPLQVALSHLSIEHRHLVSPDAECDQTEPFKCRRKTLSIRCFVFVPIG